MVCGKDFKSITKRHLVHHNMTREQYILKFPEAQLNSIESLKQRSLSSLIREASFTEEELKSRSEKISKLLKGKPTWNKGIIGYACEWSDGAKQRVKEKGAWNKNVPATKEQREKQSIAAKQKYDNGYKHPRLGKTNSKETNNKISTKLTGHVTSEEAKKNISIGMQLAVKEGRHCSPSKGKIFSKETREKISEASKRNAYKVRAKMEASGKWVPIDLVSPFILYERAVIKITNLQPLYTLENYDKPRGRNQHGVDHYQLDHIYSIKQGFLNDIPSFIIGHISNLRFIPWKENVIKSDTCEITIDELYKKFNI